MGKCERQRGSSVNCVVELMLRINKEKLEMLQGCDELHYSTDLMKSPSSSYFTQLYNVIKTFQIRTHIHTYIKQTYG